MNPLTHTTRHRLLDQATRDILTTRQHLDDSLALIHDSLTGHPRATRYDDHTPTSHLWCFTHQQDHQRCEHDGLPCGGTPITERADPTGDQATTTDPAAAAQHRVDTALAMLAEAAKRLAIEVTAWSPANHDMQRPDQRSATAPDGWCTSCWRDDRYPEPIGIRPGGTAPYYAGLCRECGDFKAAEGQLPPVEILRMRHEGRRVYDRDVARYRRNGRRK